MVIDQLTLVVLGNKFIQIVVAVSSIIGVPEDVNDFGYHIVAVFIYKAKTVANDIIAGGSQCITDLACIDATTAAFF